MPQQTISEACNVHVTSHSKTDPVDVMTSTSNDPNVESGNFSTQQSDVQLKSITMAVFLFIYS